MIKSINWTLQGACQIIVLNLLFLAIQRAYQDAFYVVNQRASWPVLAPETTDHFGRQLGYISPFIEGGGAKF